jgi:hypothetical protein
MSTFVMTDSDRAREQELANVCGVFGASRVGDEVVVAKCPDDERTVADVAFATSSKASALRHAPRGVR